jgi:hypothetical protein
VEISVQVVTALLLVLWAVSSLAAAPLAGPLPVSDAGAAADFGLLPQHDPGCLEVYNATTQAAVLYYYNPGYSIMDDAHMTLTGNAPLCAFTLLGRNLEATPQSILVSFRAGDAADGTPGALTAGPFEVGFAVSTANQTVHYEAASGYVTPNAWIEFRWPEGGGTLALRGITGATVGGTHDTVYDPQLAAYDDYGTGYAGFYAVVFTSPPVPARTATWGSVKAIYR